MPDPQISDVLSLIADARAGDRTAFNRLIHQYQEKVFRMVYFRTQSRFDAQDLSQDIFITAFNRLPGLQKAENFNAWLYKITLNKVRDFHRKKLFHNLFRRPVKQIEILPQDMDNSSRDIDTQMERKEFWDQTKKLLGQLSKMEKEVFMLRFFDDLKLQEISTTLGKSESTVKTLLYRALKKLRNDPYIIQLMETYQYD